MAFKTKLRLTNDKFEQLSGDTFIFSGTNIISDGGRISFQIPPINPSDNDLVTKKYVDDNSLIGASNGLSTSGNEVVLGGILTGNTTIDLGGSSTLIFKQWDNVENNIKFIQTPTSLQIGMNDWESDPYLSASLNISGGVASLEGRNQTTNTLLTSISVGVSNLTITDLRSGTNRKGIEYSDDYSLNYTNRSLVDKAYVDAVATGLDAKEASVLATTQTDGNIDLTGGTFVSGSTIDGVVVQDGWRVLIKNQTNAVENGIYDYIASTSTFVRSSDFDGNPTGEVTQGSFTFIVSGNTLSSTSWMVTTPDPIIIGTTPIEFTVASRSFDLVEGTGTTVTIIGGNRSVSVELAPNSGLDFDAVGSLGRLRVASSIAGQGLTLSSGILNINITDAPVVGSELIVKSDKTGTDILYIDSVDAATALTNTDISTASWCGALGYDTISGKIYANGDSLATQLAPKDASLFSACINAIGYTSIGTLVLDEELITGIVTGNSVQTANNGLTKIGNNIVLGGTLTGNTCINTNNAYGFEIGYGSIITGINSFSVGYCNTVSGNNSFGSGYLTYAIGDYSHVEGNNSFACGVGSHAEGGQTHAVGNYSHSQGGNTKALGFASHSGGWGVDSSRQILSFGCTSFIHSYNDTAQIAGHGALANQSAILGGRNHNIESGNTRAAIIGGDTIKLTGTTYVDTTAVSKLAIMSTPTSGATSDSVLVRDSTTGIIKIVAGSELGDANNIYNITTISSATTLTGNEYVVLVQSSGGTITVTLPSSPVNGQSFKIKDLGNALTNNITISGNGKNIDGAANATITTDYGAVELTYSSSNDEWYTLSFIN